MKKLPIAIQTFSELRNQNCVYVDKTPHIYRLLTTAKACFLSRPRRFGKSMTISTIKSIYKGEKHYFDGLWIEDQWDWTRRNPVIHIQFASMDYLNGLDEALCNFCFAEAEAFEVTLTASHLAGLFYELIKKTAEKHGRVVILIDEYDKPIIDYLETENQHLAHENRSVLRNFYRVVKDADESIEFFFMTGVSRFSQTGIFSHLNHLFDITMTEDFGDLVGYTQTELETNFNEWIDYGLQKFTAFDRERHIGLIKQWYNGYSWDGVQSVFRFVIFHQSLVR